MSRLIRKTTTVEEFDADDGIKHEAEADAPDNCDDDTEATEDNEDEEDEDDEE